MNDLINFLRNEFHVFYLEDYEKNYINFDLL